MVVLKCVAMPSIRPNGCNEPVSMIDEKGYLYCRSCGRLRRLYCRKVRLLKPDELRTLQDGRTIPYKRAEVLP